MFAWVSKEFTYHDLIAQLRMSIHNKGVLGAGAGGSHRYMVIDNMTTSK